MSNDLPLQIGEFLVDGELNTGRNATLYLVRAQGLAAQRSTWFSPDGRYWPRWFVCKALHPALLEAHPRLLEDMVAVARRVAPVSSDQLEQVFAIGSYAQRPQRGPPLVAVFSQLVLGVSLRRVLAVMQAQKLQVDLGVALQIGLQLASGLAVAHGAATGPVVHGGLSPARVRLTEEGLVKLVDYPLACVDEVSCMRTNVGSGRGLYYQHPARFERAVLPSDDVFSVGVMLWELLAGRSLFVASTGDGSLERWRAGRVPSLRSLGADVPAELDEALQAMLAGPSPRALTAVELIALLRELSTQKTPAVSLGPWLRQQLAPQLAAEHARLARCSEQSPHGFDP